MTRLRTRLAYPVVSAFLACFIAPFPLLFRGHTSAYLGTALAGVALLLLASGGAVTAAAASYGRRPAFARARMARALATAIEAGLGLPRAVRLAADVAGNPDIKRFVERIDESRLATSSIGESLRTCPHLTPEFHAAVATAEGTGDFRPLTRLAELYEDGFR